MGLKCAGWTARWKDYKILCAKLVAEDHKFLWWGTPYKLLRSSTPQIIILIGLNKPFGQNVIWVGAIVKRPGCNYLQLRAGCPRRVPTTLKKFPIMCSFFFWWFYNVSSITFVLNKVKTELSFVCFCLCSISWFYSSFQPPFLYYQAAKQWASLAESHPVCQGWPKLWPQEPIEWDLVIFIFQSCIVPISPNEMEFNVK
jgi:hypothetical protein